MVICEVAHFGFSAVHRSRAHLSLRCMHNRFDKHVKSPCTENRLVKGGILNKDEWNGVYGLKRQVNEAFLCKRNTICLFTNLFTNLSFSAIILLKKQDMSNFWLRPIFVWSLCRPTWCNKSITFHIFHDSYNIYTFITFNQHFPMFILVICTTDN